MPPNRQVIRRDATGRRRYLDAEWELPSGEIVVLEVDGSHHLDAANWQADMKRERSVVVSRRWVLRATTFEVRLEPAVIARDLRALGVPFLGKVRELESGSAADLDEFPAGAAPGGGVELEAPVDDHFGPDQIAEACRVELAELGPLGQMQHNVSTQECRSTLAT